MARRRRKLFLGILENTLNLMAPKLWPLPPQVLASPSTHSSQAIRGGLELFLLLKHFSELAEEIKLFYKMNDKIILLNKKQKTCEWENFFVWNISWNLENFDRILILPFYFKETYCLQKMQVYSQNNLCNSAKFSCKLLLALYSLNTMN